MAGKYGFSGQLDSSGNLKESDREIIAAKEANAAAQRVLNRGGETIQARANDSSIINPLQNNARENMQSARRGEERPVNRRVVQDAEGNNVYTNLDREGQAASVAFAAEQATSAMMRQSGIIPSNVGQIRDPMVRRAVMETGFDPGMNFVDDYKYAQAPGPIREASAGTWMTPDEQSEEVGRLINANIIPVGEEGGPSGVQKKLIRDQFVRGFKQRRGSYEPAIRGDVDSAMKRIWGDTRQLQTLLMEGMKAQPELLKSFTEFAGSFEGLQNEELYFTMMLAYYRTLEEARFADHSVQDKARHYKYGQERGTEVNGIMNFPVDPEIYSSSEKGRRPMTPRRRVMYEKMGDYLETATRTKFKNPADKQIVGNSILEFIEQSNIAGHSLAITGVDPEAAFRTFRQEDMNGQKPNDNFELIHDNGVWKLIEDVKIDENLSEFLALSKGIRDLLQPNFRKHVRTVAKTEDDMRNIFLDLTGKRSSGKSPIRLSYQNIQENFELMLNPLGMNLLRSLYTLEDETGDWNDYLNNTLSVKPEQFQILMQEDEWIKQNSPDGKTFMLDTTRRSSGRTGHDSLIMADMKPMRALTIPRFASYTFSIKRGNKINEEEKVFLYSLLGMLGMADSVPKHLDRKIKEILSNPNHKLLRIGAALNQAAKTGVLPTKPGVPGVLDANGKQQDNPAFVTIKMLEESGVIKEGLHSFEALRALDNYFNAKSNPNVQEFSSKFISELDAAQSGPTIQAAQIGNWHGLFAGGMPMNEVWWDKRKNKDSRFALPKLYAATAVAAQDKIETIISDNNDVEFVQFVKILFADADHNLDRLWNNAVGFAKTGLVGASYGQGKEGSIISIAEEIKKYFEENLSPDETNTLIAKLNATQFFPMEASIDKYTYRLQFTNNAYMQLNKLAKIYTDSMFESDSKIYDYSKAMRKAFKTAVRFADFAEKDKVFAEEEGRDAYIQEFRAPEMVYKEPKSLSYEDIYNGNWVDGMRTSMLDNHIPSAWKTLNVLDSEIFYQTGAVEPNLAREVTALDFDNAEGIGSSAISRMPVLSIHGLDDLIQAITVNELYRKYGPKGTVDPNKFNYFVSVWDAGLIQPHMRKRYMEEYNKAFAAVMKNNKFFEQLTRGWEDSIANIRGENIENPDHKADFEKLKKEIKNMRAITQGFYQGGKKYVSEDRKSGIEEADAAMKNRGIYQIYSPEAYDDMLKGVEIAGQSDTSYFGDSLLDNRASFANIKP